MTHPLSSFLPGIFLLMALSSPQDLLRQHYEAAESQRRAGNLEAAETEYVALLAEGYGGLGKIYSAERDYRQAVGALESAARYSPDSQGVLIDLAIAYFNADQYEKALEPLRKTTLKNPQSVSAHHLLGKTYFMIGDFEKASAELETAFKLAPNDYDVAYTLGLTYLKQRNIAPAKKIYDGMLGGLGDRPQLHIIFGRAYRETDFLAEALDEFKRAVALDPKFPRAHYYLGLTYLLKDGAPRLGEAAEEFKIELIAHPDEFFANYYLGIVYVIERKWDLAISFLEKASKIQPENPDPYFHLGEAYQSLGRHAQAIEALKRTITLNPDLGHNDYQVTSAHFRLGQSLLRAGQAEAGQKELEIASRLKSEGFKRDEEKTASYLGPASLREHNSKFPEMAPTAGMVAESNAPDEKTRAELKSSEAYHAKVVAGAHENIGLLRAGRQDFRAAVEHFALAAKWNPQLERINFNWGLAAYKAELYKEAIPPLEKEVAANPAGAAAKQLLGMSYFMIQDYPKASALLSSVIASKPGEAGLYYPLAVSLVKQGRMDEAKLTIDRMIAAGGNSAQVHILLGQAYQEQGDTTKALEELKTAVALNKKTPLAHLYSGLIYVKMGLLDEAAGEFESELALDPSNIDAKYHLAFVLLASQKIDRGIGLMREVIKLKPEYAEARYELGKTLLQQGDVKGAVENLEAAAGLRPDQSYVHYQLGRAYLAAGRKAEGESQLELFKQMKDKARNEPRR